MAVWLIHQHSTEDEISRSLEWVIILMLLSLPFVVINTLILFKELQKWRHLQAKFPSKSMRWIYLLALLCGFIQPICAFLSHINGFCQLRKTMLNIWLYQMIFVGIYQLLRLWFELPSEEPGKRYPLPLLLFMGTFGCGLAVLGTVIITSETTDCGLNINSDGKYYGIYTRSYIRYATILGPLFLVLNPVWKLSTLYLFAQKWKSIIKRNDYFPLSIYGDHGANREIKGIRRGLERMIVLTVFYLLTSIIFWILAIVLIATLELHDAEMLVLCVSTTGYTVAIWLMQKHNTKEYMTFLSIFECSCCGKCCQALPSIATFKEHREHFQKALRKRSAKEAFTVFDDDVGHASSATVNYKCCGLIAVTGDKVTWMTPTPPPTPTPLHGSCSSLINDFEYGDDRDCGDDCTDRFGFGVYLEYWRSNRNQKMTNYVKPRYKDLKQELTKNKYHPITEKQYDELERKCQIILGKHSFTAQSIGLGNEICGIKPGDPMKVQHAIAIKLYTDFDYFQRELKRYCRKWSEDEPIERVVERNREIAHWCRLLKEGVMFYGQNMGDSEVVYSGMSARLVFKSFMQHFECPLSTTSELSVAHGFAEGSVGIILKLKRANPKTRYLDVAKFTCHPEEKERLFMGSTLKIVDILVNRKKWHSLKQWVSALTLFEQIVKGHFTQSTDESRETLLLFLQRVTGPSVLEWLTECDDYYPLPSYLNNDEYDTDAILDDIENVIDSNVTTKLREGGHTSSVLNIWECIHEIDENRLDVDSNCVAKYVWSLFSSILRDLQAKAQEGHLWINHKDLDKVEMEEIKEALFGDGKLFDIMGVDQDSIGSVQQYQWKIDGMEYQELRDLPISEYITSPQYEYAVNDEMVISFHFRFYGRHSEDNPNCAVFLALDEMANGVESVIMEVDMKCIKHKKFQQLLKPHVLSRDEKVCGFKVFDHEKLMENERIEWVFGVKMLEHDVEYLRDLYRYFAF